MVRKLAVVHMLACALQRQRFQAQALQDAVALVCQCWCMCLFCVFCCGCVSDLAERTCCVGCFAAYPRGAQSATCVAVGFRFASSQRCGLLHITRVSYIGLRAILVLLQLPLLPHLRTERAAHVRRAAPRHRQRAVQAFQLRCFALRLLCKLTVLLCLPAEPVSCRAQVDILCIGLDCQASALHVRRRTAVVDGPLCRFAGLYCVFQPTLRRARFRGIS